MTYRDPRAEEAYEVCRLLVEGDHTPKAEACLRDFVATFPDDPWVWLDAAGLGGLIGTPIASVWARRAGDLATDDGAMQLVVARRLFWLGDLAGSWEFVVRTKALDSDEFGGSVDMLHLAAKIMVETGKDLHLAEEFLVLAFEEDPSEPDHGYHLALFLINTERVEEAKVVVAEGLREHPSDGNFRALDVWLKDHQEGTYRLVPPDRRRGPLPRSGYV